MRGRSWAPIVPGLPDKGLSKCLEKIRCPVDKQQAPAVSAGSLPAVINGEVFKVGSADATERAVADAVIGSGEGIRRCLMIPHSAAALLKTQCLARGKSSISRLASHSQGFSVVVAFYSFH